jgi:hypothetical protein
MRLLVPVLALGLMAACSSSSSSPSVSLSRASVDPSYYCPGGANNAPYDLHATLRLHNGSNNVVTIDSVTAQLTVASIKGSWLERVGDRYEANPVQFTPSTVGAGGDASLKLTIPSACTSGKYGTGVSSSAEYDVTIHLATSAGNLSITAANQHEIVAD